LQRSASAGRWTWGRDRRYSFNGDITGTLTVQDDPMFAKRHLGKRFEFVSSFDPDERTEIFIVGEDGACLAFPMAKSDAP